MFDVSTSNKRKFERIDLPENKHVFKYIRNTLLYWEEHCVECGQPHCFQTCSFFQRGIDWKCQRMVTGITPVKYKFAENSILYDCEFKKWAKLEGVYLGEASEWALSILLKIERVCWTLIIPLANLLRFIPGHIGPITIFRRFRFWLTSLLGHSRTQAGGTKTLILNCFLTENQEQAFHFTIIRNSLEIFHLPILLRPGWNCFEHVIGAVQKGDRLLFFANNSNNIRVVFQDLDVIADGRNQAPSVISTSQYRMRPAKFVKCVAWDLDNTLWKGVLAEGGGDSLNTVAVTVIKELDKRGVLHTILSKNTYGQAMARLKNFGIDRYFVYPAINWGAKSLNLKEVSQKINIGLDTFAFVDDSPFERAEVGESLPMVRVFSETEIGTFLELPEFSPPVSSESLTRRLSYLREMERKSEEIAFAGDHVEFLKSCNLSIELFIPQTPLDIMRCYELIQRSNQLNLTGRRYTQNEFTELLTSGNQNYAIRIVDRFGEYGIVGFISAELSSSFFKIVDFVLSCRVAKKHCEHEVLHRLMLLGKDAGIEMFCVELVKTGLNAPLVAVFDELPFRVEQIEENRLCYTYQLSSMDWGSEKIAGIVFRDENSHCGSECSG